jgi:4a-hydroxytetrahydrobiopterin dehydratase
MVTALDAEELTAALGELDDWRVEDGHLVRDVRAPTADALTLVDRVAVAADEMDHHPVVDVSDDRVRFTVWSHSVDAITTNDVTLAKAIDDIVRNSGGG